MPRYKKNQEYTEFKLRVNAQGRVVIPAPMREALDIKPGSVVRGRVEGKRVVLEREAEEFDTDAFEKAEKELWDMFEGVEGSMADELMAERLEEARLEAGED